MVKNIYCIKHRSCDKLTLFFIQKDKNFAIVVVLLKCVQFKRTVSNSVCSAVDVVRSLRARVHKRSL